MHHNQQDQVAELLTTPGTWAVVGLSGNPGRTAHGVSGWLADHLGMRIIPVHPKADTVHGQVGYQSLEQIPDGTQVDVVDVFVNSQLAGDVVNQAVTQRERLGIRAVWLQLGVVDEAAATRAEQAGLVVVMDTCPKIEYPRVASR